MVSYLGGGGVAVLLVGSTQDETEAQDAAKDLQRTGQPPKQSMIPPQRQSCRDGETLC